MMMRNLNLLICSHNNNKINMKSKEGQLKKETSNRHYLSKVVKYLRYTQLIHQYLWMEEDKLKEVAYQLILEIALICVAVINTWIKMIYTCNTKSNWKNLFILMMMINLVKLQKDLWLQKSSLNLRIVVMMILIAEEFQSGIAENRIW